METVHRCYDKFHNDRCTQCSAAAVNVVLFVILHVSLRFTRQENKNNINIDLIEPANSTHSRSYGIPPLSHHHPQKEEDIKKSQEQDGDRIAIESYGHDQKSRAQLQ